MQVIAIGPQGGKIVGYQGGDLKKPIYAGTAAAQALAIATPEGSPAQRASLYGVKATVLPGDPSSVQFSWPTRAAAGAKSWLHSLGGRDALPASAKPARGAKRSFLTVPRAWAEGAVSVGPEAVLAQAGFSARDKASLKVWGVKSWLASAKHPVSTPQGDGVLLGQEVNISSSGESLNGKLRVRLDSGKEISVKKALVKPKVNAPQGAWHEPSVQVWDHPKVAALVDLALASPVKNSGGKSAAQAIEAVAQAGHATFVVGGLVRDAVVGKQGADVDVSTTATQVEFAKASAAAGFNIAYTTASGLTELGHDVQHIDEGKVQCKPYAVSGVGYGYKPPPPRCRGACPVEDAVHRDFAMNALAYDPVNKVIIDPTGVGLKDALEKKLSIPAPPERWNDWVGSQPVGFLRYYKFRARGYTPRDEATRQFMINTMSKKIEQGAANHFHWQVAKGEAFRDAVIADMGKAWWQKHMAKHWSP